MEECLGRGLVCSEAGQVGQIAQEVELAELAHMDAEFAAFRACVDASGQEVKEPVDTFEEDPFGHGSWLV